MNIVKTFWGLSLLSAMMANAGDFEVESSGNTTKVRFRGIELVEAVTTRVIETSDFAPDVQRSEIKSPDGSIAYNLWSENPESCFRQETAVPSDGNSVEITTLAYNRAFTGCPKKSHEIVLPFALFDGAEYEGYMVNGRSEVRQSGKLLSSMPDGMIDDRPFRFFCIKKGALELVFDLMPLGPGDYFNCWKRNAIRGIWNIEKRSGKLILKQSTTLPETGSYIGSKLRIQTGTFADYGKLHALTAFHYAMKLPAQHQFSFGASQTGKTYTHADTAPFDEAKGFGWISPEGMKTSAQFPQGVYYSHVIGKNQTFRISGMPDGIHLITVGSGNFKGFSNNFRVLLNGKEMTPKIVSASKEEALVLTQAFWVEGGSLEVRFEGDFLLSTISTQFLLAAPEDFSCRRAFWASKGFEPAPLYRTEDWTPAADSFPCHIARMTLPTPGTECTAPLRMPEVPVELPKPDDAEMMWRYNANTVSMDSSTSSDWENIDLLKKHFAKIKGDGVNAVMIGVLFAPHCYPDAMPRDMKMHGKIVHVAHEIGLKTLEHHDTSLLWNMGCGFRVCCERIAETERDVETGLPNTRLCFRNATFKAKYFKFAKELARMGIDAFQVDEVYFFDRGCLCEDCRHAFHEETGWYLPMNELDPSWADKNSPLMKAWFKWKVITEANWYVDLRRELQKINPHISFSLYSTHWGFVRSLPRNNSASDLEEHARAIDFLGTEVMTRNPLASARALVPLRKAFNIYNFAYGTPIWGIFYNNHFDVRYFSYAISNMNKQQALISYLPAPAGRRDYQPFSAHPDNMDRIKAMAMSEIALLYPRSSRDWNSFVSFEPELFGMAQTLEEMHVPYQVIGEISLDSDILKQFKILALGSAGCLSDAQVKIIKEYAANGGTVLLSDIAGFFDETGNRRVEWAFADVFGFTTRLNPAKNVKELTSDDGRKLLLKTAVSYWEPKPLCREKSAWMAQVGNAVLPVWIERQFGKGRMIYQPMRMAGSLCVAEGAVGKKWGFERDNALAELLHTVLAKQLANARIWSTDAPEKVYATLYREPKRILVHFLNGTGTSTLVANDVMSDKIIGNSFPKIENDIHFTLEKCPFANIKAYAVSPDFDGRKDLEHHFVNSGVSVSLPKELLDIYTIVVLEAQ